MNKSQFMQQARQMLGLSQSEFAEVLGIDGVDGKRTVRKWENGEREPSGAVVNLAGVLLATRVIVPQANAVLAAAVKEHGCLPEEMPLVIQHDLPPAAREVLRNVFGGTLEACGIKIP